MGTTYQGKSGVGVSQRVKCRNYALFS